MLGSDILCWIEGLIFFSKSENPRKEKEKIIPKVIKPTLPNWRWEDRNKLRRIAKKTIKVVSSIQNSKSDWQILRKLFFYLDKMTFTSCDAKNIRTYDTKNLYNFRNYISFLNTPTKSLSNKSCLLKLKNH